MKNESQLTPSQKPQPERLFNHNTVLLRLAAAVFVYVLLRFFGGSIGATILYPITLLVTFLHEFGHAVGAVMTGGAVKGMQINPDGSGHCITEGGRVGVTLLGGYLGSAVFGNLLFYIGARMPSAHRLTLALLAFLMLFAGVFWYQNLFTTVILLVYAGVLYVIATRANWPGEALLFIGIATTLYILADSRVGPSSDMAMYAQHVGLMSQGLWTTLWMFVVFALTVYNIRLIMRSKSRR